MSTSRIASRYSKSLIDMATTSGKLDAIKEDMENKKLIIAVSVSVNNFKFKELSLSV